MENYREIFAIYINIISLFHSFPHLSCLPKVPHMMLLLICHTLQLQNNEMMLKKVHRWVNCFSNTKHYRLVAPYRRYSAWNAPKTEETRSRRFVSRAVTPAGFIPGACGLPLTSCHFLSSRVLVLLLSPDEGKGINKRSRVGTVGDLAP